MKENYFNFWYKRLIKDGLKSIKTIIGLGIAVGVWYSVNLPLGIMVFGYVLVDALIDRN
jgi:Na+-transporting NADH:ubiquinone oxidoreductase subunit NqrE